MKIKQCQNCGLRFRKVKDILDQSDRWRICKQDLFWFRCQCGSTLIMRDGDVHWFSIKNPDSEQQASFLHNILFKDRFPRLPHAFFNLQQTLADPHASALKLATALRDDPILAAGILEIANNLRFSSRQKIRSLEHAVVYIGRENIRHIALIAALGTLKLSTDRFDSVNFWEEAFLTGAIAEMLAPKFARNIHPDEAYLAGSLCNLGKFVLAIFDPKTVDKIAVHVNESPNKSDWFFNERLLSEVDHCKLGEFAANHWSLPSFIGECMLKHHDLPKFGVDRAHGLQLHELVAFSNQLTHMVRSQEHRIDTDVLNSYLSITRLNRNDLDTLLERVKVNSVRSQNLAMLLAA